MSTFMILIGFGIFLFILAVSSLYQVRQTDRAVKERWGRFVKYLEPGLHIRVPIMERIYSINVTERMMDVMKQEVITRDNLNATVDAQVYFMVGKTQGEITKAFYNVDRLDYQITNLARTTLRNIIGTEKFETVNSKRDKLNSELYRILDHETNAWGVKVLRTELKEIEPPADVQQVMNKVLKAENEKIAAIDFATATETEADGEKRAEIKKAEGIRRAKILVAEGQAQSIRLVHEAAQKYFKGNAVRLRQLDVTERALADNTKIIVPQGSKLVNIVGELGGEGASKLSSFVDEITEDEPKRKRK